MEYRAKRRRAASNACWYIAYVIFPELVDPVTGLRTGNAPQLVQMQQMDSPNTVHATTLIHITKKGNG